LLVAKTSEALIFLQKQFSAGAKALADKKNREELEKKVEKRYIALVEGNVKEDSGTIHTLLARSKKDPRKQRVYLENELHPKSAREAITEYKVLKDFKDYTLLEVKIKTGRRHQIRCHFSYLQHPVAGDKLYNFKNSKKPEGLTRQFLHSAYLKIQLPSGETKEFLSELPEELEKVINKLKT
jgi:23S rRNA pseudouridine1911/1915/1917 synthase